MMSAPRITPPIRVFGFVICATSILAIAPGFARGADLIERVDEAYAARGLEHEERSAWAADPESSLSPRDLRFFEDLFSIADEVVLDQTNVMRWFGSAGTKGLHPVAYSERVSLLVEQVQSMEVPTRASSVRGYLVETLSLQRDFALEWHAAIEGGEEFHSQLTNETAYHEGLHRSQRLLLKIYAELRALFPETGEATKRAIRMHLHGMVLR